MAQILVFPIPVRKWRHAAYKWLMAGKSTKHLRKAASDGTLASFVATGFDDPALFDVMQELYNFFREREQYSFNPVIRQRITARDGCLLERMKDYTDKEMLILTDADFVPKGWRRIEVSDIEKYKDDQNVAFLVAYDQDFRALETVKTLTAHGCKYYVPPKHQYVARYFNLDRHAYETLEEEAGFGGLFCPPDFENIFQALTATRDLPGAYVEIGVFQGASSHAALNYMRRTGIRRESWFLDTYEGFTYDEAQDSEDQVWKNSHQDTSIDRVKNHLSGFSGVHVVKNNCISDPFPAEIGDIVVANLDVDMYEAVKTGLKSLATRVVRNGILIAEDYGHTPSLIGAQKAVYEFLEENPGIFTPVYMSSGQIFLVKRG
jgi:hypothetical protein